MQGAERGKSYVGIIAGDGNIASITAQRMKRREDKVIGIGIGSENRLKKIVDVYYKKKIYDIDKILDILERERVQKVVLIGRVDKRVLLKKNIKDKEILSFLEKAKDSSLTVIMTKIDEIFTKKGIVVLPQSYYLSDFIKHEGLLTTCFPGPKLEADIEYAFKVAKDAVNLDIAQALSVKDKILISIEDISGTDELIERTYVLTKGGFVLAKVAKDNHDYRFDMPVVGLRTIELLIKYKAKALIIERKKTIFLDLVKAVDLANKNNLVIISK